MKSLKISIITATYNSAFTLEQTILSVVEQTYQDIEYIIIDGGSTDGTVELIKKYGNRIACWVSEPDKGVYDAFNKGVKAATGDYIYFLGADDCLCDVSTIERVAQELYEKNVDILSAAVWLVDEKYRTQNLESGMRAETPEYDFSMIPHQGMFVRRELLLKNLFDTSYRIAADYLFFLTCFFNKRVRIKYISLPVAFFSSGGISGEIGKLLEEENSRIREMFNLPLCSGNKYKLVVKFLLDKIGVLNYLRQKKNNYIRKNWKIHHCEWKICRWCGRGV